MSFCFELGSEIMSTVLLEWRWQGQQFMSQNTVLLYYEWNQNITELTSAWDMCLYAYVYIHICIGFDVHKSVHRDTIMKVTN
jgi:hypothetical protein